MWRAVASARFTPDWTDKRAAIAAYERHNGREAPGPGSQGDADIRGEPIKLVLLGAD